MFARLFKPSTRQAEKLCTMANVALQIGFSVVVENHLRNSPRKMLEDEMIANSPRMTPRITPRPFGYSE